MIYFPYSFLGLTLFFLVMLFSSKKNFPIIDFYLWGFSFLCILLHKPISYQLFLAFFILYQYLIFYIKGSSKFSNFLIFLGLILTTISPFIPIVTIINILFLSLVIILDHRSNRKKTSNKQSEQNFDLDEEDDLEIIIPLVSSDYLAQEKEYVIPIPDEE